MKERKEKLKRLLDSDRFRRIILIAGALGIALIFLSNFISFDKPEQTKSSASEYGDKTERELESFIERIEGAGETEVMLTVENGGESVYLQNGTTKTKEIAPKIRGVLIVCEGGDDPVVAARISDAVTKALDISAAKVCIVKLSN